MQFQIIDCLTGANCGVCKCDHIVMELKFILTDLRCNYTICNKWPILWFLRIMSCQRFKNVSWKLKVHGFTQQLDLFNIFTPHSRRNKANESHVLPCPSKRALSRKVLQTPTPLLAHKIHGKCNKHHTELAALKVDWSISSYVIAARCFFCFLFLFTT